MAQSSLTALGRHSHQQAVHRLLVATERLAQLGWHGHDGVKIVARQELGFTRFEPLPGPASMTFGARPVAAAVETPERLVAVVASVQDARRVLGCSRPRYPKGPFVARASSRARIVTHTRGRSDGTMSANSTFVLGRGPSVFAGQALGSTMVGAPSLEETLGGLAEQSPEFVA